MSPEQRNRRWSGVRYEHPDDVTRPFPTWLLVVGSVVGLLLWFGGAAWWVERIAEWVR